MTLRHWVVHMSQLSIIWYGLSTAMKRCFVVPLRSWKKGRQTKRNIYEEKHKPVDLYAGGLQACLNALRKGVVNFATPADVFKATFDIPLALAPKPGTGICSQGNAAETFQFCVLLTFAGASLGRDSFY